MVFKGVTGDRRTATFPAGLACNLGMEIDMTITDASIVGGQTLDQAVTSVALRGRGRPLFEGQQGELSALTALLSGQPQSIVLKDPTPTTATQISARYIFGGPFYLPAGGKLDLGLKPSQSGAWDSATDAQINITTVADYIPASAENVAAAVRVLRDLKASGTKHDVNFASPQTERMLAMYLRVGAASKLTRVAFPSGAVFDSPTELAAAYASYKDTTPTDTPTEYLVKPEEQDGKAEELLSASAKIAVSLVDAQTLLALGLVRN